jgi:L-alanine-DL-glutamate epimerase-like enolase superfamily enzyme
MKITGAESFLLRTPLETAMGDSMQTVRALEFVGLKVQTDEGLAGTGYTITVGHGGSVIQEVLDSLYIPELGGKDPFQVREIWAQLYYGKGHWIGRAGATTMAQSAVDIALWDLIARSAGRPLWQVLGGCRSGDFPIYNTHAGWLNFSKAQLAEEASALLAQGYRALKMKVGLADTREDYERVKSVRRLVGDQVLLMVDANQGWDLLQARLAARMFEELELAWLEEPLHPDDVQAHGRLRASTSIPLALGEHLYSTQAFRDYMAAGAVDVVQVDVCRIGGITPWLEVAALAQAHNLRVCPHCGDLMQVHQHLVRAIPNSWYLEVIPIWKEGPFLQQIRLQGGKCLTPQEPGASTEFSPKAFEKYRLS